MTGHYGPAQALIVTRIWKALPKPSPRRTIGKGITQRDLAAKASRVSLPVPPSTLRALWPLVERRAARDGLWVNRPVYGGYQYTVSRLPYSAARTMIQRWRHVVARIANDARYGIMLLDLTRSGDREIERNAQRVYDAYNVFLDAADRYKADLDDLAEALDLILKG